jgi:segregation and condensation protein B
VKLDEIKAVLEALLFVSDKPLTIYELTNVIEVTREKIEQALLTLVQEYSLSSRGIQIKEVAGGYKMYTAPRWSPWVRKLYKVQHETRLSQAALETLAIIAYKQPVTKATIEALRGVNIDGVLTHLLQKRLIKIVGRKALPGRPFTYGTTKTFLEYFGLKDIKELPKIEELKQPSSA